MNLLHFIEGLFFWAVIGIIIASLIYVIAYVITRIYGYQSSKSLIGFVAMIIIGLELSYILRVILGEFGISINEIFTQHQTAFIVFNALVITLVMISFIKKKFKKDTK